MAGAEAMTRGNTGDNSGWGIGPTLGLRDECRAEGRAEMEGIGRVGG